MSEDNKPVIALIDDEPEILNALVRLFRHRDWITLTCTDARTAHADLRHHQLDLVISDYRMPGIDGVTLLNQFKQSHPDALRIVLSGQADLEGVVNAVNDSEVYRFILKPWSNEDLLVTLDNALRYKEMALENQRLAETVRRQQRELQTQKKELERLESEAPGITRVERDQDGFITLSDED
ncbi:response regulator [Vreelandella utahensis]|uniref:response regulator n=1 Tax=Vreelandella halophila TaxID=86177 RepID=UPI00098471F5|nr:response regulator [Halomonas utahensis]